MLLFNEISIELVIFAATNSGSLYITPPLESVPNANEHCVFAALSISSFFFKIQSHNVACFCSYKLTICSDLRKLDLNFSVRYVSCDFWNPQRVLVTWEVKENLSYIWRKANIAFQYHFL